VEHRPKNRVLYLDGFRGVAILLVVFFHAFARWPDRVPYGYQYAEFFLVKYGWLGVNLFFMVSGFVIYMTLEKCTSFREFLWRRWLRLFPAMLVVSIIVYMSAEFFERPAGIPTFSDLIPGLFFIEPIWIGDLFGVRQGVLVGAFWSLFVEVKFYFIFGSVFYLAGREWAKAVLAAAFFLSLGTMVVNHFLDLKALDLMTKWFDTYLSFKYFGWFLIGALVYELQKKPDRLKMAFICILAVSASFYASVARHDATMFYALILIALFTSAIYLETLQNVLSAKILLFIGFISYPFYLIHENIMIFIVGKISTSLRPLPDFLIPIIPVSLLALVAYLIAKFIEPLLRSFFSSVASSVHLAPNLIKIIAVLAVVVTFIGWFGFYMLPYNQESV